MVIARAYSGPSGSSSMRKIAQANAAVGTEGRILPDTAPVDVVFDDTREEIERIAAGDASLLEEREAELDAFSGEVFREELRQALMAARERELQALPWGIGSGLESKKAQGVVFVARAGSRIEWRYVPLRAEAQLSGDRLALLGYVRCTPESDRHLPDEVHEDLYSLWGRARDAIFADRMAELDPATRFAAVPKAQRDAVDVLLAATTLDPLALDQIIEALSVAWPPTVARALRPILDREDESTNAKAERGAQFVRSEGLRAPELPAAVSITRDDVHLVCYQVITS